MKTPCKLFPIAIGISLLLMHASSQAIDAVSVEIGQGNETRMGRVGLQWDGQHKWRQRDGRHIAPFYELSLAHWRGNQYRNIPGQIQNISDLGVTPLLRWQRNDKKGLYGEAGIGAHWLSAHYNNNGSRLSTHFQFGSHLGVGYVFQNMIDIGLKYQHLSNGGIKKPNSGVNFLIARATYRF